MSTYYDLYETPSRKGDEPNPLHARVRSKGTISGKDFIDMVFREEHMPHAMIVGILEAITSAMGKWMADGYTVELEGLGFFTPSLKCVRAAKTKKDIRAESVRMSTVNFRPTVEFKRYVAFKMELERADKRFFPQKPEAAGELDERKRLLLAFLDANVCITRAEYARLVRVTARRATSDLQAFIASGVIRKRGGGRSVVYIKA